VRVLVCLILGVLCGFGDVFSEYLRAQNSGVKFTPNLSESSEISEEFLKENIPQSAPEFTPAPMDTKFDTVLLIGDSIMEGIAMGFEKEAANLGLKVINAAKQNTGLYNKKYFDWSVNLDNRLKNIKGNVLVLAHFGPNDTVNTASAKWKNLYKSRIQELYDAARKNGATLGWLEVPCMKRADLKANMPLLNAMFKGAAKDNASPFFGTSEAICRGGEFQLTRLIDGKSTTLRAKDGIHLSPSGAKLVAKKILNEI